MTSERLPSLDLLRGGAAFGVAIPHLLLFARPDNIILEAVASLGVEVFFVLSGYVLAPQIMRCFLQPRDLGVFLRRRWLRTVPPYLLALICVSLVTGKLGSDDFLRYAVYGQNLLWQANGTDYFSIAWSLSVEEWFYCVFPLVLIASHLWGQPSKRRAIHVAIGFILTITVLRTVFGNYDLWGEEVRRVVIFRIDAIAFGFLLHLLPHRVSLTKALIAFAGSLIVSAAALAVIIVYGEDWAKALFPIAAAAFGASAIMLALCSDKALASSRPLSFLSTWLGRISFSVYLFHQIITMLLVDRMTMGYPIRLAICLVATIAFAVAFYVLFEKPILDARPRYRLRTSAAGTSASGASKLSGTSAAE